MISNNYQNNLNYGAVKDILPKNVNEKLPQNVQNYDVKERVGENPAVKAAQNAKTDPLTIGLTGAIWLAFAQGCQLLNNKLNCDWDKSWLGKIGSAAEKLGNKMPKGNGKIKNFINGIFDKSDILRSLKTPTKAQNGLAVSQARGISGYVMSDVRSMLEYHLKNGHGNDILDLVKDLNPNLKNGEEALSYIGKLFDNCENNQAEIKNIIKKLSNSNIKVTVDNIINTHIGIPRTNINFNIKIPNVPFLKRKGSFKEMANKLNAVFENSSGLGKEVTSLGKSLPKNALKTLEGLTNGGAGGKLMIIIQAGIFAQAIKKAIDAPEGEKLSTFSENIANDFGFFLSLPFQVKASHTIGGLKYIGINGAKNLTEQKAAINQYHAMVKNLNEKVAQDAISHIDYLKESKKIKDFLKGDSKWWQKPFKALGKLFSTGLDAETIMPYIDKNNKSLGTSVYNSIRNLANKLRGKGLGTVLRFAVGTMVVGPFIAKGITKISHLIFGRPTKSVLDEDKKEETQNKTNNNQLNMTQEEMMQKLAAHPELIKKMESDPEFLNKLLENPELMAKYLNGELKIEETTQNTPAVNSKYIQQPQMTQVQSTPAQTQVQQGLNAIDDNSQSKMDLFGLGKKKEEQTQTQEETSNKDPLEPVRSYIPSSDCAIQADDNNQSFDPSINNALLKAEQVEKRALEQLNNL